MKIGFIGVGGIADNYLGSLAKLERPVAAVCDVNAKRTEEVANRIGAKPYADYKQMLADEKLDIVFVCVPPFAHENQVADAAKAGANLFVAKPVGLHLDQALRARDAIVQSGVLSQAGYMTRYSDITERAKSLVGDRQIGLATGRFVCNMGSGHPWWGIKARSGGQMLEQTTHCFDWLRYFLGEVEEVSTYGHYTNAGDTADFEDSSACNIRFKSGTAASVLSTCVTNTPSGHGNELFGREFYLRLDHDHKLTSQIDGQTETFEGQEAGYFRQIEHFLKAVETGDKSLIRCDFEDAVRSLAVTIAANESLEKGMPVQVPTV